jgi:DNA-binding LacI/PurR family transcriptional regulator
MTAVQEPARRARRVVERAKYPQLVEWLSTQINQGKLEVGDRLPPFVELQAEFGVTPNTVNRAMIELEQRGLIERRHGSGVYVAPPRVERTGLIGVCVPGFDFTEYSSYWASALQGIQQGARHAEVQVLLLDQSSPANWDKADGVIVCDWGLTTILRHMPPQMPCVSLLARTRNYPSVTADDYGGMRAATEYLLSLGHRKIATLYRSEAQYIVEQRLAAFRDVLDEGGITPDARWNHELAWIGDEGYDYGRRFVQIGRDSMRQWLADGWRETGCTAILAQNDEAAIGVIEALQASGIRVPEEVSVVGFDGTDDYKYFSPRPTTVKLPLVEIAAAAVEMLMRRLKEPTAVIEHRVFPVELRVGESTAPPPE